MNRRIFGTLCLVLALVFGVGSCKDDPLSSLTGTPTALVVNFTDLSLNLGATGRITASVVDGRSTPLTVPVTFAACDANVVVAPDTAFHPVPATASRAVVTGQNIGTTGISCVNVSGGGFNQSVRINILPTSFAGVISSTTPQGGSVVTIRSLPLFKFSASATTVTFGGSKAGTIVSRTADSVKVLVPFGPPGVLSITGVQVTYVPGFSLTLPSVASVTQTGDAWTGANSWQTAPDITTLLPAAGTSSRMIITATSPNNAAVCPRAVDSAGTGPCSIFKFVLADTATFRFSTDWEGGSALAPNVDTYVCSDSTVANFGTACYESGAAGATNGAAALKPEAIGNFKYPAGTHYFVVETYGGSGAQNHFITITRP